MVESVEEDVLGFPMILRNPQRIPESNNLTMDDRVVEKVFQIHIRPNGRTKWRLKSRCPADATSGSFTPHCERETTDAIEHPFAASDVKAQLVKLGYKKAERNRPNGGPFSDRGSGRHHS